MKIQLQNLTKKFPNRNKKAQGDVIAVDHFTYEIPDGKLIGLLGPLRLRQEYHTQLNLRPGKTHGRADLLR